MSELRRRMMMERGEKGPKYVSAIDGAYIDLNGSGYRTPVEIFFRYSGSKYMSGNAFTYISTNNTSLYVLCYTSVGMGLNRERNGATRFIKVSENPVFTFNQKLSIVHRITKNGYYWCRLEENGQIPSYSNGNNYREFPLSTCTFRALSGCDSLLRIEKIRLWDNAHTQILHDWVAEQQNGEWGLYDLVNEVFCGNSAGVGEIVGGYEPN